MTGVTAIIGAGLAGLTAARELSRVNPIVRVFEKADVPGGRVATKKEGPYSFDPGAQYFTARDPRFREIVDQWFDAGTIGRWDPKTVLVDEPELVPLEDRAFRYVGVPDMNQIARQVAAGLQIQIGTQIVRVEHAGRRWRLWGADGRSVGMFDTVIVATPPSEARWLLSDAPLLAQRVGHVSLYPCWSALAVLPKQIQLPFEAAIMRGPVLSWAAFEASKPGRPAWNAWVLHATASWSTINLHRKAEDVAPILLEAFFRSVRVKPVAPVLISAHLWESAQTSNPLKDGSLWDPVLQIGVCGDWCYDSRVEGAVLSGLSLAHRCLPGQ